MKYMKKRIMHTLIFVGILIAVIQVASIGKRCTALAAGLSAVSGHDCSEHPEICYDGTRHVHTDECYSFRSEMCGGRYVHTDSYYTSYREAYGYCDICGTYYSATAVGDSYKGGQAYTKKTCSVCKKNGIKNQKVQLYVDYEVQYKIYFVWNCDCCGARIEKYVTDLLFSDGWSGSERRAAREGIYNDPGYDVYGGTVHREYVTKRSCICDKSENVFYDENGEKCTSICDRIVTLVIPHLEEQVVNDVSQLNTKATLYLYDGTIIPEYECVPDEDSTFQQGEWADIKIRVLEEDYPYSFDASSGIRERTPASCSIRVKQNGEFDVDIEKPENGMIIAWTDSGEITGKVTVGREVYVIVRPYKGYHIDNVDIDHDSVTEENGELIYRFIMPAEKVNISASFEPNTVKIIFDPSGGRWGNSGKEVTRNAVFGRSFYSCFKFPPSPTLEKHTFLGWYTAEGERYSQNDICRVDGEVRLYAMFISDSYTNMSTEFEDFYAQPFHHSVEGFTSNSDTFWRMEEYKGNGTGDILYPGTVVQDTGTRTFYGHWDAKKYEITFDPCGGILDEEQTKKTVLFHDFIGELPAPYRKGYLFKGWYSDIDGRVPVTEYDIYMMPEDIVLYASWKSPTDFDAVVRADVCAVNNDEKFVRNAAFVPVTTPGDKIEYILSGEMTENAAYPVTVSVVPRYSLRMENGESETVHVYSIGVVQGKIIMFYEHGTDVNETLYYDLYDSDISLRCKYVLPHLSYIVTEEDHGQMLEYSAVSTLSGYEAFFTKGVDLIVSFDITLTDVNGRKKEFPDAFSVSIYIPE